MNVASNMKTILLKLPYKLNKPQTKLQHLLRLLLQILHPYRHISCLWKFFHLKEQDIFICKH